MKKLLALSLFVLLSFSVLLGQYEDRFWIMGRTNSPSNTTNVNFDFYPGGVGLYDTNQAPPGISPPPTNIGNSNGFEGWGVVTDPQTGDLLFYTDGEDVFDADHQDITPSGGLGANASSSQAVAVAVNPVCPFDQYYIFSNPTGVFNGSTSGPVTYRTYTIDQGFSAITALPGPNGGLSVGEGMAVIPSRTDPFTSWLIVRLLAPTPNGSDYVVYRIDETGIAFEATYNFGPAVTDNPYSPIMNMTYVNDPSSTTGVIVGFSVSGSPNRVFINFFNTATGAFVGSAATLATFSSGTLYDLEFSPGGNYVYYASYFPSALYQVPIAGGTAIQMRNFGNFRGGGLKRAPDGYVYHIYEAGEPGATTRARLGRIVRPEEAYSNNFNDMYQADFNSSVSMIFEDVFSYNFPEFAGVPTWSVDLSVEGGNLLCPGNIATITATINSLGQEVDGYSWEQDGAIVPDNDNPILATDEPGVYQVTVNLEGGCSIISDPIIIAAAPNPPQIDDITTTETTCGSSVGSITITASGGTGQLLFSIDGETYSVSSTFLNLGAGLYPVSVQDEQGCTTAFTVEVEQSGNPPEITAIDTEDASCLGTDGSLSVSATGGTGQLQYSLDGVDFQMNTAFGSLPSGTYTVVVQDEDQCINSMVVELGETDNGPQIEMLTSSPASCQGTDGQISVQAVGENGGLSYSIDGVSFQTETEFLNLAPGTYVVSVQDELGCLTNEEIEVTLDAVLPVFTGITVDRPDCNLANGTIQVIGNGGTGNVSYALDGFNFQPTGTFAELLPGTYNLTIQDELGCQTDSTVVLLEGNCPVYVPNAFSPNRDGVNDRFHVFSNGDPGTLIQRYQIFDRWGELVFENTNFLPADQSQFWDGTFRGRTLGTGVYVYLIEVGYADGSVQVLSGDVALVR
ncbi:MAG: gliding motility-associated C-terminal domain-containing protein [Bacteroidota bacterium]